MDPEGYYALLGVQPNAATPAIAAAYRAKARLLHPDVPGTGNADAFIRLREAYDVLGNEMRRAHYDRQARAAPPERPRSPPVPQANELPPLPDLPELPVTRRGMRIGLTAGLIALAGVSVVELAIHIDGMVAPPPPPAGSVAAQGGRRPAAAALVPTGTPTHYVLPSGGAAPIWRYDPAHNGYIPAGRLQPFAGVAVSNAPPHDGMVEIHTTGGHGYMDATRLAPGDQHEARNAFCSYNAGPPLLAGEVLARHGDGGAAIQIDNGGGEALVLKLRDADGATALSVVTAPGTTHVGGLKPGSYTVDYASGTLWSRACGGFVAGERSWRAAGVLVVAATETATVALPAPDATEMPPAGFADQ